MFVDSHAHIDGEDFDIDRDDVVERARNAGVLAILNVGTGDPHSGTFERAVQLAEQYEYIYAALGVHPHDARLFDEAAASRIQSLIASCSRVIAWGEIGLDYHYDHSPRDVQREVFAEQLRLARRAKLPVIIHTRAADEDTAAILRNAAAEPGFKGIMHCFGGGPELLKTALDLDFLISFAGNVTFKKAEELRAAASNVPLDRLLIETDCPFLTPVPFRGRRNEPARVLEVARALAELHGTTTEAIGMQTTENFQRFFGLELGPDNRKTTEERTEFA